MLIGLAKAAVPLLCALLLAGCSSEVEPGAENSAPGSAPASPTASTPTQLAATGLPTVCEDHRVRCEKLPSKNVAVVYPHKGKSTARGVLYWDAGGPGQTPLDGGATRQVLPAWTRPYDLVVIAEPWTYKPTDPACSSALIAAGVTGTQPAKDQDSSTCDWNAWRLDPADITTAATEIDHTVGQISGVYAESFGAIRSYPVMKLVAQRGGFVVMDSPAPTPTVSGIQMLKDRWKLTLDSVPRVPDCSTTCVSDRRDELRTFLHGTDQLDATQAGLGLAGLAPNLADNEKFLETFWGHSANLSRSGVLAWKQSAHDFNRSNSANEPAADLVSYIASICAAYSQWPTEPENPVEAMHAICSDSAFATHQNGLPKLDGNLFLAVNDLDTVVPAASQAAWASQFSHAEVAHYRVRAHASAPDSVNAAVERWLVANAQQ